MIFVEINYNKNKPLGKCKVIYEEDKFFSEKTDKEKRWLSYLQQNAEIYNKIAEQITKNGFPDLYPSNYKNSFDSYPLYVFAPATHCGILDIPCDKIVGDNWANIPLKDVKGNYPNPCKVQTILMGYLNLNEEMKNTKDTMMPIPVYKIFDDYFYEEGNHRLYTARLLGLPTVRAKVYEIDYISFLKKTRLFERANQDYLGVLNKSCSHYSLYPITPLQKRNYNNIARKHIPFRGL